MKRNITIFAIILLIAGATALFLRSQQEASTVKIGYITTLSGGAGIIGKQMQNAVELAMVHKDR